MGFHGKARAEASQYFEPEEGGEYKVVVVEVREKTTTAGFPGYSLWLEILDDGPGKGERFWDGIYFSKNNRANGMSYAKLEAASPLINDEFWARDPEFEDIEKALMGSTFSVLVTYDENDRDPAKPWLRCTYIPSDSAGPGDVLDVVEDDPF